jgi:hypothetical protein
VSYTTVKNGIANIVKGLGYKESDQIFDFDAQGENEYSNKFIINCNSAENTIDDGDMSDRYDDEQEWEVQIAFKKGLRGLVNEYDKMHRKREELIRDLDDWNNTQSFVIKLRYLSFTVEDLDSYFVLNIKLQVIDRIAY